VQFHDTAIRTQIVASQRGTQLSTFLASIGSLPKTGSDSHVPAWLLLSAAGFQASVFEVVSFCSAFDNPFCFEYHCADLIQLLRK
jgi:hypothetical protein